MGEPISVPSSASSAAESLAASHNAGFPPPPPSTYKKAGAESASQQEAEEMAARLERVRRRPYEARAALSGHASTLSFTTKLNFYVKVVVSSVVLVRLFAISMDKFLPEDFLLDFSSDANNWRTDLTMRRPSRDYQAWMGILFIFVCLCALLYGVKLANDASRSEDDEENDPIAEEERKAKREADKEREKIIKEELKKFPTLEKATEERERLKMYMEEISGRTKKDQ